LSHILSFVDWFRRIEMTLSGRQFIFFHSTAIAQTTMKQIKQILLLFKRDLLHSRFTESRRPVKLCELYYCHFVITWDQIVFFSVEFLSIFVMVLSLSQET